MSVEEQVTQLAARVEYLEKDVYRLVDLLEHLYCVMEHVSTEKQEEVQKLRALVAQVRAFAREKTERFTR
jgi:hypothetical protein